MKSILWGSVVSAAAMLAFVAWLVVKAPRGTATIAGSSVEEKVVRLNLTPVGLRQQKAKDVIADQAGSRGIVIYESFKEFQIGAGQALVVRFDLQEVGGKRSKNIWTFSFDKRSGDIFNINKVQQ